MANRHAFIPLAHLIHEEEHDCIVVIPILLFMFVP